MTKQSPAELDVIKRALELLARVEALQYGADLVGAHLLGSISALNGGLEPEAA